MTASRCESTAEAQAQAQARLRPSTSRASHTRFTPTLIKCSAEMASPSPVSYSLASLCSCTQVTGSVIARDRNIKLGGWNVAVEGLLPTAVSVEDKEGNPNWEKVTLKVKVQTDIKGGNDDPKFKYYVSEAERRCPITELFVRSGIEFHSEWENEPI